MADTLAPPAAARPPASPAAGRAWSDRIVEPVLAALACVVLALIAGMVIFVFTKAWPSFEANGLRWFGPGGNVDDQLLAILSSPADSRAYVYEMRAWPLLWGTAVTTGGALVFGGMLAVLSAVYIVEFASAGTRRVIDPVVRLLAAVPSVVYGLIGILVLVPFVGNHLISEQRKESVAFVVQLSGESLLVAVAILTVMITPIMIAIIVDALEAVPSTWKEGAAALGVNRWRVMWTIVVRAARPAIIAAGVLAVARALGEAIMLAMVAGSVAFAPNPIDGLTFLFEPTRPLAATIVNSSEGLSVTPFGQTIYAFAAVLLVSTIILSWAGWAAKRPLQRYGVRG